MLNSSIDIYACSMAKKSIAFTAHPELDILALQATTV